MEQQSSTNSSSVNFDRKNSQNKSFRLATSDRYQREEKEEERVFNNIAIESIGVNFYEDQVTSLQIKTTMMRLVKWTLSLIKVILSVHQMIHYYHDRLCK